MSAAGFVFSAAAVYKYNQGASDKKINPGQPMARITIVSRHKADEGRQRLTEQSMPLGYMGDYSIPGIWVERLPEALELLEKHRFDLVALDGRRQVVTDDLQGVRQLFRVLENAGIGYGSADLIDGVYQG